MIGFDPKPNQLDMRTVDFLDVQLSLERTDSKNHNHLPLEDILLGHILARAVGMKQRVQVEDKHNMVIENKVDNMDIVVVELIGIKQYSNKLSIRI